MCMIWNILCFACMCMPACAWPHLHTLTHTHAHTHDPAGGQKNAFPSLRDNPMASCCSEPTPPTTPAWPVLHQQAPAALLHDDLAPVSPHRPAATLSCAMMAGSIWDMAAWKGGPCASAAWCRLPRRVGPSLRVLTGSAAASALLRIASPSASSDAVATLMSMMPSSPAAQLYSAPTSARTSPSAPPSCSFHTPVTATSMESMQASTAGEGSSSRLHSPSAQVLR
mmetsp:Transcript_11922/g.25612  ORF Transcript_11922/g.25612 Transcript_11922/m.25612 type:complete len:225 (-) Transcript_11922:2207-2881(-)